jgi:hypothetical protein
MIIVSLRRQFNSHWLGGGWRSRIGAACMTQSRIAVQFALLLGFGATMASPADQPDNVYATYGTHNAPDNSPCAHPDCAYVRRLGEPTDPTYSAY